MNDKVNVNIVVPEIDKQYNMLLPINKKMRTIINLWNKSVSELSSGNFPKSENCKLYNSETMETYDDNTLLYNTNIRNGTKLILLSY